MALGYLCVIVGRIMHIGHFTPAIACDLLELAGYAIIAAIYAAKRPPRAK